MQTDPELGSVFYYPRPHNFLYAQISKSVSCYFLTQKSAILSDFLLKKSSKRRYTQLRQLPGTEKVYNVIQFCEHCVYTATNLLHFTCAF